MTHRYCFYCSEFGYTNVVNSIIMQLYKSHYSNSTCGRGALLCYLSETHLGEWGYMLGFGSTFGSISEIKDVIIFTCWHYYTRCAPSCTQACTLPPKRWEPRWRTDHCKQCFSIWIPRQNSCANNVEVYQEKTMPHGVSHLLLSGVECVI